ncbi:MAG: hypothetical protein RLO12_11630, partial [Fulvivirga sp.]
MILRKDLITEIIYSLLVVIILLVTNDTLTERNESVSELFKSLIVAAIFYLLIKSQTNNFSKSLFIVKHSKFDVKTPLNMVKSFSEIKLAVFLLGFCGFSMFSGGIDFELLQLRVLQLIGSSIYALTGYAAIASFRKEGVNDWNFMLALVLPYMIIFLLLFYSEGIFFYASLILPSNIFVIKYLDSLGIAISVSLVGLVLCFTLFILSIQRIFHSQTLS